MRAQHASARADIRYKANFRLYYFKYTILAQNIVIAESDSTRIGAIKRSFCYKGQRANQRARTA